MVRIILGDPDLKSFPEAASGTIENTVARAGTRFQRTFDCAHEHFVGSVQIRVSSTRELQSLFS